MSQKSIELIMAPPEPHFVGDGFRVHTFIPSSYRIDMYRMNPFIMMDYNSKHYFPPSTKPKGVGVHPHRGFETVTIAYKGRVAHHDSSGGGGVIGEGDVQWMTAASGVLHKEYHEETFSKEGGDFQMVQLWVNLPAKDKMSKPKYQAIANSRMARIPVGASGASFVELIAGEYATAKGPADTFTPLHMSNAKLQAGDQAEYHFPATQSTCLVVVSGDIRVNGEHVPQDHFCLFERKGEDFTLEALTDAVVLVLSGEPIPEPIAAHGPFVMNTREELVQAFNDFNQGKFGYLEE
jgi:quercetin 2,3-dioxygenase